MRTIRVSEEVWNEIAKRGKFGETPDDVLRRVFSLDSEMRKPSASRGQRHAKQTMHTDIKEGHLIVNFVGGASNRWALPSKNDKEGIRRITEVAMKFAEDNNATDGQINAVRKALTDKGYHITK